MAEAEEAVSAGQQVTSGFLFGVGLVLAFVLMRLLLTLLGVGWPL